MRNFWLSSVLVILPLVGMCQYENILIGPQESGMFVYACEPSIAINPCDTNLIVAGAVLDYVYYSTDGGRTWTEQHLTSTHGVFGDPCILATSKGDFYYFHLSDPSGNGWSDPSLLDRIVCQRSMDGGKSWSPGASIGYNGTRDQDKEWATSSRNGRKIYVTWTQFDKYDSKLASDSSHIFFSKSNRKAEKWSKPIRINQFGGNCLDDDWAVEGAVPTVDRKGNIYVAWALGESIYFDRSLNGGKTWMDNDIVAGSITGGWRHDIPGLSRCNGMPITCCDNSGGANDGTIYINFADQRNGNDDTDVWLIKSQDHGNTWSEAVRVNNDNTATHQFMPWMTVDQSDGTIYCVFYDRRSYDGDVTDVYLAWSTDGGQTFLNERINTTSFIPNTNVFFGDYTNISAVQGQIRPIWTQCDGLEVNVWTAIIKK
jgi:hypothetical protein